MKIKRGVAICHYNRPANLYRMIDAIKATVPEDTQIVVCDDGSPDFHANPNYDSVTYILGPNLGVAHNKNRGLAALQHCDFICLLEDDLIPTEEGWFEMYEEAAWRYNCHHFCRVQKDDGSKLAEPEKVIQPYEGLTPVYRQSPRGDLTFITKKVLTEVGMLNPRFKGCGYAHGEWSQRIANAGLIPFSPPWVDIEEARDCFEQSGDTEGGRFNDDSEALSDQIKENAEVRKDLDENPQKFVLVEMPV